MSRFFLGNCMAHANIVVDTFNRDGGSRFFDDGTLAADSRREYSVADKVAIVGMLNARAAPPKFIRFACENVIDDHGNPCGDEGRACESCQADAMADHAYLRGQPRHAVFNDQAAIDERNQDLRDAGRGHLVSM